MIENKKPSLEQRAERGWPTHSTAHDSGHCRYCNPLPHPPGWAAELVLLAHRHGYPDLLADLGAMRPVEAYGAYLWLKRQEAQS